MHSYAVQEEIITLFSSFHLSLGSSTIIFIAFDRAGGSGEFDGVQEDVVPHCFLVCAYCSKKKKPLVRLTIGLTRGFCRLLS